VQTLRDKPFTLGAQLFVSPSPDAPSRYDWRVAMDSSDQSIAVLVVEDDALVRMQAATTIEAAGFRVYEAGDAAQAVLLLEECSDIRVLFTDVDMPGAMNGLALARYARIHRGPIKIIIASGRHEIAGEDLPPETVFLGKPYRLAQIVERVQKMTA
jgi:two-component system, response regulator PdtaR